MKLYVLGPAFGLASIDPDCVAAVALVKCYCQRNSLQWQLIASPGTANERSLPAMQDGEVTISGFSNIARHLEQRSEMLKITSLSAGQMADSTSLCAFIESNGQPLLDISLYVSFENYRTRTRSAFTRILPWYANYILPPRRRAAAKARTEHLGVSSLDMDNVHEDLMDRPQSMDAQNKSQPAFEHETEKRARTLLGRRETVRSMLRKPEHVGAFRLKTIADAFFEPLQAFLKEGKYLLGTEDPSPLDCLAYGYLSLMLYPNMPQDWLSSMMRKQYPKVVAYVERLSEKFEANVHDGMIDAALQERNNTETEAVVDQGEGGLPWTAPEAWQYASVASFVGQDLLHRIPFPAYGKGNVAHDVKQRQDQSVLRRYLPSVVGLVSTAVAIFGYWAFQDFAWPHGETIHIFGRKRLADYGEAGAALAALGGQMQFETNYEQQQQEGPVHVDVVLDNEQIG